MAAKIMVDTASATAAWETGVGSATSRLASATLPTVPQGCGPVLYQALAEAADDLRRGQLIGRQYLEELTKAFRQAMVNLDGVEATNSGTDR